MTSVVQCYAIYWCSYYKMCVSYGIDTGLARKGLEYFCFERKWYFFLKEYMDMLVLERCNSIANALELCLSCISPSIYNLREFPVGVIALFSVVYSNL